MADISQIIAAVLQCFLATFAVSQTVSLSTGVLVLLLMLRSIDAIIGSEINASVCMCAAAWPQCRSMYD